MNYNNNMKNYKLNKKTKLLNIIILTALILVISFYLNVIIVGGKTDKTIENFISKSEYVKTIENVEYYKVIKEDELNDTSLIFNGEYIGTTGDIYLCSSDPFGGLTTKFISKKIRIGHGAIVYNDNASKTIEIVGNKSSKENVVKEYDNEWLNKDLDEFVVLRVKDINNAKKVELKTTLDNIKNSKYNYFYLLHAKNRYYCIDLISRVYSKIGLDIDNNKTVTTGSSIINNDSTYLIYYMCKINGVKRVYYLSEE